MGLRYRPQSVPQWMSTLGEMKRWGTRVICSCGKCHAWRPVDLDPLGVLLDWDGSLWDRRPPCEEGDCPGLCLFLASPGTGTPMRPLKSDGYTLDDLPPQAWMGGWTGAG